jgi:hypothetical protein
MEDLSGRDKIDVEQWVRIHHTDPRSKHKLQTLDALQQTSILEYCEANVHFVCKPTSLPGGVASREYKMRFGQFQGWTIENMVKDSNHKVRAGGQTAGEYLLWVCDPTKGFTWRWKDIDHVHLLLGLWDQYCTKEKQGLKLEVHTGNGKKPLDVQPLMRSYSKWLENLGFFKDPPDDVEDNNNADLDDDDDTCQDPHDIHCIYETDNSLPSGTLDFFQETVKSMHVHPYRTWSTLWARAPHPVCSGDAFKNGTEAVNKVFGVYDIHFYSPQSHTAERHETCDRRQRRVSLRRCLYFDPKQFEHSRQGILLGHGIRYLCHWSDHQ